MLTSIKLQHCDPKAMWQRAASSQISQPFVFCTQYAYRHQSRAVWCEEIPSRWSVWSVSCRASLLWWLHVISYFSNNEVVRKRSNL